MNKYENENYTVAEGQAIPPAMCLAFNALDFLLLCPLWAKVTWIVGSWKLPLSFCALRKFSIFLDTNAIFYTKKIKQIEGDHKAITSLW